MNISCKNFKNQIKAFQITGADGSLSSNIMNCEFISKQKQNDHEILGNCGTWNKLKRIKK